MLHVNRFRKIKLLFADLVIFYLSLYITLAIRGSGLPDAKILRVNLWPFSIIYIVWVVIFYIAGLYELEKFISLKNLRSVIFHTMFYTGIISVIIFYVIPYFGITPKTILLIDAAIVTIFVWFIRRAAFVSAKEGAGSRVYFFLNHTEGALSESEEIKNFKELLKSRPQLGYKVVGEMNDADMIVIAEYAKKDSASLEALYMAIFSHKTIVDFSKFYESVTGKVPVYMISKVWFLQNLIEINKRTFETLKRWGDIFASIILLIPTVAIFPFVALVIKLTSSGPVLFRQARVGKNGKTFELIKFRSMIVDAERSGYHGWAKLPEGDKRITFIGNILRKTRIDELPQIWNILRGEMSLVGPRPERPEFVRELSAQIPHYKIRHLVEPGLTGWGQINFSEASARDAVLKLQYDLYYIKNRSIFLEAVILLKTILIVFKREGK